MRSRISFSSILEAGQRIEIGRYELPWSLGFPGFSSGSIIACFQMAGSVADWNDRLKRVVRYWMPRGPRCLNSWIVSPSALGAVESLLLLMAART